MDATLRPKNHRFVLAPFLGEAKMQAYWCIRQVRNLMVIPWITALVQIPLARQLWISLFNGKEVYEGFTLDQTLAYVTLSMAIFTIMKGDGFLYWKIRTGDIINELMYPVRWTFLVMASGLASMFFQIFIQAVPLMVTAALFLKIPLPTSPSVWLAFTVSFLLGCLIFNILDILANMMGFFTTELHGLLAWKDIIAGVLSGAALPLWIFPGALEKAIAWLPFRGMQYVPLSILVGWIPPGQYLREMGIQVLWVIFLWLVVERLYELAMKKYEVQGG